MPSLGLRTKALLIVCKTLRMPCGRLGEAVEVLSVMYWLASLAASHALFLLYGETP